MARPKSTVSINKDLIWSILIHVAILYCALLLAYVSYKVVSAYLYGRFFLSYDERVEIKGNFLWIVLLFVVVHIFYSTGYNKKKYSNFLDYSKIILSLAVISNIICISKSYHITIVLNLSLLYFTFLLLLWSYVKKVIENTLEGGLEISDKSISEYLAYFCKKPSAPFILVFIALLASCTFISLVSNSEKSVSGGSTVAYCALVIGVGIEVYQLFCHGSGEEKEQN